MKERDNAPLRVGVLGCAEIARRRMLPAFAACPDTEVVAVAGRDAARTRETARPYGARALHGYEALLADAEVQAVYVPLPAALHATWVEAALEAGKHVLAEKPLTLHVERTRRLFARAQELGLTLRENVMFPHHSQHRVVKEILAGGELGRLRGFHAEFTVPARPAGDIRLRPELGGGALWDTAVYPVRAATHLLGPDLNVVGAYLRHDARHGVDTAGAALLHTPEGVTAQLTFGLDHGYRSRYEVTGERGRLTLDHAFTPPAAHVPRLLLERADGREERQLEPDDQVAGAVAAFTAAVREAPDPRAASDSRAATDSRRQAEILAAIASASGLLDAS